MTPSAFRNAVHCLLSAPQAGAGDVIEEAVLGWPLEKAHVQGRAIDAISPPLLNAFFSALVLELFLGECTHTHAYTLTHARCIFI